MPPRAARPVDQGEEGKKASGAIVSKATRKRERDGEKASEGKKRRKSDKAREQTRACSRLHGGSTPRMGLAQQGPCVAKGFRRQSCDIKVGTRPHPHSVSPKWP